MGKQSEKGKKAISEYEKKLRSHVKHEKPWSPAEGPVTRDEFEVLKNEFHLELHRIENYYGINRDEWYDLYRSVESSESAVHDIFLAKFDERIRALEEKLSK